MNEQIVSLQWSLTTAKQRTMTTKQEADLDALLSYTSSDDDTARNETAELRQKGRQGRENQAKTVIQTRSTCNATGLNEDPISYRQRLRRRWDI